MTTPLKRTAPPQWQQLLARAVVHPADLPPCCRHADDGLARVAGTFPMKINAGFIARIQSADDPLGRQVIPHAAELDDLDRSDDPLAENAQSPVPQVIHRYPHRVVFLVSNRCAVHCRFCMRKRRVARQAAVTPEDLASGLAYIRGNARITEVILSGGDPLMLADEPLARLLGALREIRHVRLLRIHTRIPAVLPQRITQELADMLAGFHPLFLNIHCNHPAELTEDVRTACGRLADAGIPLGSQTVLLRGVNDDADTLYRLFDGLLALRVRPYYLHQIDRVPGTAHFRVPLEEGLALMTRLRGRLSGMAVPHYMVDLPGGGGKVALTPEAVVHKADGLWRIRNWQGDLFDYPVDDPMTDSVDGFG